MLYLVKIKTFNVKNFRASNFHANNQGVNNFLRFIIHMISNVFKVSVPGSLDIWKRFNYPYRSSLQLFFYFFNYFDIYLHPISNSFHFPYGSHGNMRQNWAEKRISTANHASNRRLAHLFLVRHIQDHLRSQLFSSMWPETETLLHSALPDIFIK